MEYRVSNQQRNNDNNDNGKDDDEQPANVSPEGRSAFSRVA